MTTLFRILIISFIVFHPGFVYAESPTMDPAPQDSASQEEDYDMQDAIAEIQNIDEKKIEELILDFEEVLDTFVEKYNALKPRLHRLKAKIEDSLEKLGLDDASQSQVEEPETDPKQEVSADK